MLISIVRVRIRRLRIRSAYQLSVALFHLYLRRPVAVMHFSGQICLSILTALGRHVSIKGNGTSTEAPGFVRKWEVTKERLVR